MTTSLEQSAPGTPPADLADPLPPELDLTVVSRNPTRLSEPTIERVMCAAPPRVEAGPPRASVIVVAHNNLVFTRLCLQGLLAYTHPANYEVTVVDNASTDGTHDYLRELSRLNPHVGIIRNDDNRGFAPANNQALAQARGEVLVLLNNDTVVTPGWLEALRRHVADAAVGCVCASTNRIGNEAEVDTSYRTLGELLEFAHQRAARHAGEKIDIPMAPMFCLAMRREVFEQVGPIDEQYEMGFFEDDDYSMRVRAAGLRVCCADDVFVHHFGGASFSSLVAGGEHGRLFRTNRERFEKKWNVRWTSHQRGRKPDYDRTIESIHRVVARVIPRGSTIAVISRGDDELLKLEGQRAWHFPRMDDGQYAGHYPAESAAAVAHLESLRDRGAEYLLIPRPSMWWIPHYPQFGEYLAEYFRQIETDDGCCVIFELRQRSAIVEESRSEHWQDRHLRELAEAILPAGVRIRFLDEDRSDADFVLVAERQAGRIEVRPELVRGFWPIVRRENVGLILQREAMS